MDHHAGPEEGLHTINSLLAAEEVVFMATETLLHPVM